jgi:hypothetical protein
MHLRGLEVAVVDAEVIEHLRGALEAGNVRTGMDGGVWDSISRGGDSFLNAVEIYNSVSDLVDDLEEKGNDNPATWWGPILSGAAGLATGGDVPLIAAAAGFLTSLFSGGDGPQVPLSWAVDLTGDFKINGTIQTSPDLAAMRVYVPGTPPGRDPRLNPFYTEPLGIYALTARPVLDWWSWPHNWRGVNVTMDTNSIIVNPSSGLRLRSVKTAIVWRGAEPKRFVVPAVIPTLPRIRMTQAELAAAKVGLLLEFERIDRPDLDPNVLYREYEAERVTNGVADPDGGPQP